ncbi:MAG: hypothetical protein LLG01_08790 [Planctomycetaceae bacterium]|nr:hypothetical protein [Planctomycetaceae bacterium]
MSIRNGLRVALSAALMAMSSLAWAQDNRADQAKALLDKGLTEFRSFNYRQAKATLLQVNADALSKADRTALNDRLSIVDGAIKGQAAATEALVAAEEALKAGKLNDAAKGFQTAAASPFLPPAQRQHASEQAALIARKQSAAAAAAKPAPLAAVAKPIPVAAVAQAPATAPTTAPAQNEQLLAAVAARRMEAKRLLDQGKAALDANDPATARRLFERALQLDPDLPEARRQLDFAAGLMDTTQESTPVTELERRRRVARQMVDLEVTRQLGISNETLARADSVDEFKAATNAAQLAMDALNKSKELYSLSDYRRKVAQIEGQLKHIENRQAQWTALRAEKQLTEMRKIEQERIVRERAQRQQLIATLMTQARTLKSQRKFQAALEGVERILVLDPGNRWAAEEREYLSQFMLLMEQKEVTKDFQYQHDLVMIEQKRSETPWWNELQYPRDWRELTERRKQWGVTASIESDRDRAVHKRLKERIKELKFEDIEFKDVIQFLRDVSTVNIYVKWGALSTAGISKSTTVNVHLQDVSLEKALRVILEDVGASAALDWVLDDGVITISTRDDLATKTMTRVYDIRDLLINAPIFVGPRLQLATNAGNQGTNTGTGLGGGLGGTGTLGGTVGGQQALGTTVEQTTEEMTNEIVDLIKKTIAPDTWANTNEIGIAPMAGQLVITQTAQNHEKIMALLGKLREARALQISIEARFIQVRASFLQRIGFQATITVDNTKTLTDLRSPLTFGGAPIAWSQTVATGVGNDIGAAGAGGVPVAFQISDTFIDDIQVAFLLQATQADAHTRTLTAPRVTLFNGQRSYIALVRTQTYVDNFTLTRQIITNPDGSSGSNQTATVTTADLQTGTMLDVQAVISDDRRYVTMTLRPQISTGSTRTLTLQNFTDPITGSQTISAMELPTTLNSEVSSTISCPDGGTLLLGSLKKSGEATREEGIPIASKIPILNRLTSNRSLTRDDDVLLILIKPKIIIQKEQEELAFP